ncbi:MAG: hypothetical protein H7138_09375 [Myxococcales bacterium]|nr:hypothetical protein [Myxococcales bacterium]
MIATASELRAAFDRTFAEALPAPMPQADVLAIDAGGELVLSTAPARHHCRPSIGPTLRAQGSAR